jgi:hypothetical protein
MPLSARILCERFTVYNLQLEFVPWYDMTHA